MRPARGSASSGRPAPSPSRRCYTQPDLVAGELVPLPTIPDVLAAVERARSTSGFVAIENAIEGTVNVTLDTLAFDVRPADPARGRHPGQLCLMALPGVRLDDITTVDLVPGRHRAVPRRSCARTWPRCRALAANSTAEAARRAGRAEATATPRPSAPARAAEVYGLEVAGRTTSRTTARTRPASWPWRRRRHPRRRPATTRRRSWCSSGPTRPGSLLAILQEFAARAINLIKLESRPDQAGAGRLLLSDRPRGPHRRRGGGRLPARPQAKQAT